MQFEKSLFSKRVVHSQSTLQRQLRHQILENTLYTCLKKILNGGKHFSNLKIHKTQILLIKTNFDENLFYRVLFIEYL
jgi:hypothetical protein